MKESTPQKTPVHSVVAVICDILAPLENEERLRALVAVMVSLGIDPASMCANANALSVFTVPGEARMASIVQRMQEAAASAHPNRRDELLNRIAANKDWLSKNWHLGKDVRRGCQANIEADERELAKIDAQSGERAVDAEH